MNESIRQLMERWARYRHFRHGGYGKTMMQRCLEGMPGTHCPTCGGRGRRHGFPACPTCSGTGRVQLKPQPERHVTMPCKPCKGEGEIGGVTCIQCRGRGHRIESYVKVNPAYIPSTYREPGDAVSERIDRLVCELKRRDPLRGYWYVIDAEYCDHRGGTQEIKAERLLISGDGYRKRLQRAVEWIDDGLRDLRPAPEIPWPYRPAQIALDPCHKML